MKQLNLTANGKSQEIILAYLKENVSDILADKINNGVFIEKDGKQLINKKTLDGFMTYANGEAKKLAEKSTNLACVEDSVVYGWAMHYFEEDSIEGKLYNEDGTPYTSPKPVKRETKKPATQSATTTSKKPEPKQAQFSLFDMITDIQNTTPVTEPKVESKPAPKPTINEILEYNIDDELTNEEIREALEQVAKEEKKQLNERKKDLTPFYTVYLELEKQYPNYVVIMRLGDFYEVFGDNAIQLAEELNLTLTSRHVGLEERLPMIGFPYHAADTYFLKIHASNDMVVYEDKDNITPILKKIHKSKNSKHWVDDTTYVDEDGVIHTINTEKQIPEYILQIFGNRIIAR